MLPIEKLKYQTWQLKTACSHLMPMQQHQYNGLARPTDYCRRVHVGTGMDLPVRRAYSAAHPAGKPMLACDKQLDGRTTGRTS